MEILTIVVSVQSCHGILLVFPALSAIYKLYLPALIRFSLLTLLAFIQGPMSAVVVCLLALRDQFVSHVEEGWHCSLQEKGRMHSMEFPRRENSQGTQDSEVGEDSKQMETKLQKVPKSPAMSGEILLSMCSKLWAGDFNFTNYE